VLIKDLYIQRSNPEMIILFRMLYSIYMKNA